MDAHAREAAAAQAAIADFYGTVWKPKPGDRVRCPLAFGGGYQEGTVFGRDSRPDSWLVDTPEGRLALFTDELERITPGEPATALPVEPCRAPEPLTTPANLGSHNVAAARKAGCEDEYDNAIEARYGKGW